MLSKENLNKKKTRKELKQLRHGKLKINPIRFCSKNSIKSTEKLLKNFT